MVQTSTEYPMSKRIRLLNGDAIDIPMDETTDMQTLREAASLLLNVPVGRVQFFHQHKVATLEDIHRDDLHVICLGGGALVVVPWFEAPYHLDCISGTRYTLGDDPYEAHRFCVGEKCIYVWDKTHVHQVHVLSGRTLRSLRLDVDPHFLHWRDGYIYVAHSCAVDCHLLPEDTPVPTSPAKRRNGQVAVRTSDAEDKATLDVDQMVRIFMAREHPFVNQRRRAPPRDDSAENSPSEASEAHSELDASDAHDTHELEAIAGDSSDDASHSDSGNDTASDGEDAGKSQCERKWGRKRRRESVDKSTIVSESDLWNPDFTRMNSSSSTATEPSSLGKTGGISAAQRRRKVTDPELNQDAVDNERLSSEDESDAAHDESAAVPSFTLVGSREDICVECLCAVDGSTIYVGYRSGKVKQFSLQSHEVVDSFIGSQLGHLRSIAATKSSGSDGSLTDSVVCLTPGDCQLNLTMYHRGSLTRHTVMDTSWTNCMAAHDGRVYFGTLNGRCGCYRLHPFKHLWTYDAGETQTFRRIVVSTCGTFVFLGSDTEVVQLNAHDGRFSRAWRETQGVKELCIIKP